MKSRGVQCKKLAVRNRHQCMHQCRGAAGGASYIFFRKMHLVNHPFRLDSQRFLSYSIHMRALTLALTPVHHRTFWDTIYFYAASATAGNQSS